MATGYEVLNLTFNSNSGVNRTGFHIRQVIPVASLVAAGAGNGMARVTIRTGASTSAATLDHAYIGESGASEPNFDGNQVQLTFNGSASSGPHGVSETFVSDPVAFTYSAGAKLVISMHWSGTDYRGQFLSTGPTGANFYGISFADTQTGSTIPANPPTLLLSNQTTIDIVEMLPPVIGWHRPSSAQDIPRAADFRTVLASTAMPVGAILVTFPPGYNAANIPRPANYWAALRSTTYPILPFAYLPPAVTTPAGIIATPISTLPIAPNYAAALASSSQSIMPLFGIPVAVCPLGQQWMWNSGIWNCASWSLTASGWPVGYFDNRAIAPNYAVALASTTQPILVPPPAPPVAPPARTPYFSVADPLPLAKDYRVTLCDTTEPVMVNKPVVAATPAVMAMALTPDPIRPDYSMALESTTHPVAGAVPFVPVLTPSRWIDSSLGHLPIAKDYSRTLEATTRPSWLPPPPQTATPSTQFSLTQSMRDPPMRGAYWPALSPAVVNVFPVVLAQAPATWWKENNDDPLPQRRDYSAALASTSAVIWAPYLPPPPTPTPTRWFNAPIQMQRLSRDLEYAIQRSAYGIRNSVFFVPPPPPPPTCVVTFADGTPGSPIPFGAASGAGTTTLAPASQPGTATLTPNPVCP